MISMSHRFQNDGLTIIISNISIIIMEKSLLLRHRKRNLCSSGWRRSFSIRNQPEPPGTGRAPAAPRDETRPHKWPHPALGKAGTHPNLQLMLCSSLSYRRQVDNVGLFCSLHTHIDGPWFKTIEIHAFDTACSAAHMTLHIYIYMCVCVGPKLVFT